MSAINVRPIASVPIEPWRNGGGVTRALATRSNQWRISLAEIARDGPYSRFEGISRISLVLRGRGLTLRDENVAVQLRPFETVEYNGDAEWKASLIDGPVTALNVMIAQGRYRTRVRAVLDSMIVRPKCAAIVVALDGGCTFSEPGTDLAGNVGAGHVLVINDVTNPLWLAPTKASTTSRQLTKSAVLVTIEPSSISIND